MQKRNFLSILENWKFWHESWLDGQRGRRMEEVLYQFPVNQRQILEQLPVPLCVFQLVKGRNRLLLASDGILDLLGISRSKFLSTYAPNFTSFIHPDDIAHVERAKSGALLHSGGQYQTQYRIQVPNGEYLPILCGGRTEITDKGCCLFYSYYSRLTGNELSGTEDSENQGTVPRDSVIGESILLAKSQSNLTRNQLIEYAVSGSRAADLSEGDSYEAAVQKVADLALRQEDKLACKQFFDREKLIRLCHAGETHFHFVYRRRKTGDDAAWISFDLNTFSMPENDEVYCSVCTYDISEQVRNQQIMERIASTEFDIIALIYVKTREFELIKKSGQLIFPPRHQRIKYRDCIDYIKDNFVLENERDQYESATDFEAILAALNARQHYTATYKRMEDGEIHCKQTNFTWLDRDQGLVLLVRSDVTPAYRRDQEQLREIQKAKLEADHANEAKSMFLSGMSHDLRTPLNGIIGFTDIALREKDQDKKQQYLEQIRISGALLRDLIDDTLELSRIESGKMVLNCEAVDTAELAKRISISIEAAAQARNIHIHLLNKSLPQETLWTDKIKLQKIILNLLTNAVKYTPEGGTVSVGEEILDPPVKTCTRRIIVEDTGIGMSPEFLTKLYEPFAQEHRPEAGNVGGTGLGLSIVKRIVDLMNGFIEVQSSVGKGTRFEVSLPLQSTQSVQTIQKAEKPEISLRGKTVLLCEDNYLNTEIALMLLQEAGLSVDCVDNGQKGVDAFRNSELGSYDAILMDIRMPVMDGYEAARTIRVLPRSDAAKIPIIAMTADAFEEDIQHAREAGLDGHVTKPIEPGKLLAALRNAIEKH